MNGRVAAVLGAAIARRFAGEGFTTAMMSRREESLTQIRQGRENDGGVRRSPTSGQRGSRDQALLLPALG